MYVLGRVLQAGLFPVNSRSHHVLIQHLLCAGFPLGTAGSEWSQASVPQVSTELILVTQSHVSKYVCGHRFEAKSRHVLDVMEDFPEKCWI